MRIAPQTLDAHVMRREKFQARIDALTTLMSGGGVPIASIEDRDALVDDVVKAYGVYERTHWFLVAESQLDTAPSMRDLLTELLNESYCYTDEDRRAFRYAIAAGEFPVELSDAEESGLKAFLTCLLLAELHNPFEDGTLGGVRAVLAASPPTIRAEGESDSASRDGYERQRVLTRWLWAECLGQGFHTRAMPIGLLAFYNDRTAGLDAFAALGEVYELLSGEPLASLIPPEERETLLTKMRKTPTSSVDELLNSPDERVTAAYQAGLVTDEAWQEYRAVLQRAYDDAVLDAPDADSADTATELAVLADERAAEHEDIDGFLVSFAERDAYCASFRTLAAYVQNEEVVIDTAKLAESLEIVLDGRGLSHYGDDDAFFPAYLLLAQAQARISLNERPSHVPSLR